MNAPGRNRERERKNERANEIVSDMPMISMGIFQNDLLVFHIHYFDKFVISTMVGGMGMVYYLTVRLLFFLSISSALVAFKLLETFDLATQIQ